MVNYEARLDAVFRALADPTRRRIVARLARGESSVTELAEPFDVSLPAVSKHLRVLEDAGLLVREREGRVHRCRLGPSPLDDAAGWIARSRAFWEAQLDALGAYLAKGSSAPRRRVRPGRRRPVHSRPRRPKPGRSPRHG